MLSGGREDGKVASCKIDGTNLQIHIERPINSEGKVDIVEQYVGIILDVTNNWLYWTQKGNLGCLFSASLIRKTIKPQLIELIFNFCWKTS